LPWSVRVVHPGQSQEDHAEREQASDFGGVVGFAEIELDAVLHGSSGESDRAFDQHRRIVVGVVEAEGPKSVDFVLVVLASRLTSGRLTS